MNRTIALATSLAILAAGGLTACGDQSVPAPTAGATSPVNELSETSPGQLPPHIQLTPPPAPAPQPVPAGGRFIIEFAADSPAASAVLAMPNGNPFVALPAEVQQGITEVTNQFACPIADTVSVGARMRLSLQCPLDERQQGELQRQLATVAQVSVVEPDLIATHQ